MVCDPCSEFHANTSDQERLPCPGVRGMQHFPHFVTSPQDAASQKTGMLHPARQIFTPKYNWPKKRVYVHVTSKREKIPHGFNTDDPSHLFLCWP